MFGIDGKEIKTIEDATLEICGQVQITFRKVNAILDAIMSKFDIKLPPPPATT
jgi:hypothetical protein